MSKLDELLTPEEIKADIKFLYDHNLGKPIEVMLEAICHSIAQSQLAKCSRLFSQPANENNPYPKTVIDEVSGAEVPNERWRIWQEGFNAGRQLRRAGEELKEQITQWVTAYKDIAERNALAETPTESAEYLLSLVSAHYEAKVEAAKQAGQQSQLDQDLRDVLECLKDTLQFYNDYDPRPSVRGLENRIIPPLAGKDNRAGLILSKRKRKG